MPLYTGLLTDIPGSSVVYRSSDTLSLINIPVYTPGDRPLYPRLLTNILGNNQSVIWFSNTMLDCVFIFKFKLLFCPKKNRQSLAYSVILCLIYEPERLFIKGKVY